MTDRFEKAQRTGTDDVGGVFGLIERDPDMALGAEVVDLVGCDPVDDRAQPAGVGEIAVMEEEPGALVVRVEGVGSIRAVLTLEERRTMPWTRYPLASSSSVR